jgi:dTMP kinase
MEWKWKCVSEWKWECVSGYAYGVRRARFIVIEGIDGAGTTTQARLLVDHLNERGMRAHLTREPSDGPVGRLLREILGGAHAPVDGATMTLLFAADRMDHLAREIEPALGKGLHVVSDRYYHSSFAYQTEEADIAFVRAVNARARKPDLTLLLDLSAEEAARRRAAAGRVVERYDDVELQRRIALNYRTLMSRPSGPEQVTIIDGGSSIEEVQACLRREVEPLCGG